MHSKFKDSQLSPSNNNQDALSDSQSRIEKTVPVRAEYLEL